MQTNKYVWLIASCPSDSIDKETCTWLFFEEGTLGVQIEDTDDSMVQIKASFNADSFGTEQLDGLRHKLERAGLAQVSKTLKIENIANEDWLRNWKKYFVPFPVGDSFFICPPWQADSVTKSELGKRKKLIIDPGMAFGTGQHATTRFCLEAIESLVKGPNVLDVGTGSGILSIACALTLPDTEVLGLDIDENAIHNAEHNVQLNKVERMIQIKLESPEKLLDDKMNEKKFNAILSNLTSETIIAFLPIYHRLLSNHGVLVLAGIIQDALPPVESAIPRYQFKIVRKMIDHDWVGIVLAKTD